MDEYVKVFSSKYCPLPICDCGIEKQLANEHRIYHFRDRSKYYHKDKIETTADQSNRIWPDDPVNTVEEKNKNAEPVSLDEIQAYMPYVFDKISPSETYIEDDLRVTDTIFRTAQKSTLTTMLPLKPMQIKRKESDWGTCQETMQIEYSYDPPGAQTYKSMMTRYRNEMIISKIPSFR